MKNKKIFLYLLPLLIILLISASMYLLNLFAREKTQFEIEGFDPLTNWTVAGSGDDSSRQILLDYSDALQGFSIPSVRQCQDGKFVMRFRIRNTGSQACKFYYRLYYQNESYKFPEKDGARQHPLAHENFYGSWDQADAGFIETPTIEADGTFHEITASFKIRGNPRNETRYYNHGVNERWKRNPRTGKYEFMLVVIPEQAADWIPQYIHDIGTAEKGVFINPFYFFRYGDGSRIPGAAAILSPVKLNVTARPDLSAGIYARPEDFKILSENRDNGTGCGSDSLFKRTAPFRQFIHYIDQSSAFNNIPLAADISKGGYSITDYNWNKAFTPASARVPTLPVTAGCPCENVGTDSISGEIMMRNQAGMPGARMKQNAGVITRHGFTYGTYTVKIKMQKMLSPEGLWNGLTNAIWLITESEEE